MTANLLRTPPLSEQLGDQGAEVLVGLNPPPIVTCSTRSGSPLGIEGLIAAASRGVAAQLARNRRRCAAESFGNRAHAQPTTAQIGNLDPFLLRQVARADLADR